ncbi:uncharacterized protein LOC136026203 isoform X2 [Artemia franciscana]|uniref:uncharacterized protein LOC136026203 isoform X2 n=1 Tax=Artemia franciscana TaxID=6661 RepID=UPI0032DAE260
MMAVEFLQRCLEKEQSFVWYSSKAILEDNSETLNDAVKQNPEQAYKIFKNALAPNCSDLAVEFKHVEGKRRTYFSCLYALGQKKNKKSQKPRSVGLVFSHEQDVIFSTTSKINQIIIDALSEICAIEQIQSLPLDGRDIDSLVKMVAWKGKKRVPVPRQSIHNSVVSVPPARKRRMEALSASGQHEIKYLDRSVLRERLENFDKAFPPANRPKLNRYVISVKEENPRAASGFSVSKLEIRSSNLVETLEEMVSDGVIPSPMPEHFQKLLVSGKNHVEIIVPKSSV